MQAKSTSIPRLFQKDSLSAVDSISLAQFIAFSPYVFQASVLLRDAGILSLIESGRQEGLDLAQIQKGIPLSPYAVRVLVEAGLGIGLIYQKEEKYALTKTGHFFLNDRMTRINTDFMRDVCYDGAQDLKASLEEGRPAGLRHLGPWETIYQGLSSLEEPAKSSWFQFDHYFSDPIFPVAAERMAQHRPSRILDIGANTGRFSQWMLKAYPEGELGLVDLEVQLELAREQLDAEGLLSRCRFYPMDLLKKESRLPQGYDIMWMSQFLDCFSEDQIVDLLIKCREALPEGGRIYINETFWDRQQREASAFSLQMISLYFTTMANGNSQMYAFSLFETLIRKAGLELASIEDNVGFCHTLVELRHP